MMFDWIMALQNLGYPQQDMIIADTIRKLAGIETIHGELNIVSMVDLCCRLADSEQEIIRLEEFNEELKNIIEGKIY